LAFLAAIFLGRLLLVVDVVGDELELLDAVRLREVDDLVELEVPQGPGLDRELVGRSAACTAVNRARAEARPVKRRKSVFILGCCCAGI
jgi:hypothetical protein